MKNYAGDEYGIIGSRRKDDNGNKIEEWKKGNFRQILIFSKHIIRVFFSWIYSYFRDPVCWIVGSKGQNT